MMKKGSKRKGGIVGRDRTPIVLRIDPALAEWLAGAAEKTGQSRSKLMEGWLASLRAVVVESEDAEKKGLSPFAAVEVIGAGLVSQLVRNGFGTEFLGQAWREHLADRQRLAAEVQASREQ